MRSFTTLRVALVGAAFFAGALISRTLLSHASIRYALDLSQPFPVITWWGNDGVPFIIVLFGSLAAAYAAYLVVLAGERPSFATTLGASALALCAGLLWLPLFSSDVYAYAAYGDMLRAGINPYLSFTGNGDPLIDAARWQWSGSLPACVYGPAFVCVAAALVSVLAHSAIALQIGSFRILSCGALLLSVFLMPFAGERSRGYGAALFFGLNPCAIWAAVEGHNDALMLAIALAGIALARRNAAAGTFLATLSGAIKAPGILAGVVLAMRERRSGPVIAGLAALAVLAVVSVPMFYGALHHASNGGRYAPHASVQALSPLVAMAIAMAIVINMGRARTALDRLLLGALAAWLAIPNPYPWYGLWLLPLAAWSDDGRLRATTIAVTAAAFLRYVPDASALPGAFEEMLLGVAATLAYVPLLTRSADAR